MKETLDMQLVTNWFTSSVLVIILSTVEECIDMVIFYSTILGNAFIWIHDEIMYHDLAQKLFWLNNLNTCTI